MTRISVLLALLVLSVVLGCFAQPSISDRFNSNAFTYKGNPAASATISTKTFYAAGVVVYNNTGSDITVTYLRDRSTDCEGHGCPIIADGMVVPAYSEQIRNLPYIEATSGAAWSASVGTGVTLRIVGTY